MYNKNNLKNVQINFKKFYNLYTSSKISYQNIMCSKKYSYVSY